MPPLELAELCSIHPALLDSAVRWRGVGGWGATGSLMRSIATGAVCIDGEQPTLALELVPGVATPKRQRAAGPFVEHGHVEGLTAIDRGLLSLVFDEVSHDCATNVARIAAFRRTHPLEFWRRLKSWQSAVDAEAARLRKRDRLTVTRSHLWGARGQLVDALYDESISDSEWARLAGIALVANLDDVVVKTAGLRREQEVKGRMTGSTAVLMLACLQSGRRSGIDIIRRLFSPLRPSSYPPAQYTKLVLPPYRGRPRFVDDGSLRLGG